MQELLSGFSANLIVTLVPIVIGAFKAFKFVHEGERGIKLRFGKAIRRKGKPRVIEPGFVLLIPWMETLKRHHVRQQTIKLTEQEVMVKDGLIFNVGAVLMFRVTDVYRALFEIDDLESSLRDLAMGVLRDELSTKSYHELEQIEVISKGVFDRLKTQAEEWGVEFIEFKLTDCAPSTETAPLIIASAGVELKMKALEEAAKKLEMKVQDLDPALAAALVGVPMVTTVTAKMQPKFVMQRTKKEAGFIERTLG